MKAINDDGVIGGVCSYLGKHTPLPIWFWNGSALQQHVARTGSSTR